MYWKSDKQNYVQKTSRQKKIRFAYGMKNIFQIYKDDISRKKFKIKDITNVVYFSVV